MLMYLTRTPLALLEPELRSAIMAHPKGMQLAAKMGPDPLGVDDQAQVTISFGTCGLQKGLGCSPNSRWPR